MKMPTNMSHGSPLPETVPPQMCLGLYHVDKSQPGSYLNWPFMVSVFWWPCLEGTVTGE